jgi:undecaprenyl-diphosphatase
MLSIFKDLNYFAKRWRWLDLLAIFCARFLPYLMVVFMLVFSLYRNDIRLFFYAVLSGVFARFVVNELVHLVYKRQRPPRVVEAKVLIPLPRNYSFPSGHASFFFGLSFLLFFFEKELAIIFIILTCVVTVSRVFCGVHWFRDILAGALAGLVSSIFIYYLTLAIK